MLRRQHLEGDQQAAARVARQVDGAHAALGDGGQDVKRAQDQAERRAGEQLARLEAGEAARLDEVVGDRLGLVAPVQRQAAQQRLQGFAVEQSAAEDGPEEALDRGRRRAVGGVFGIAAGSEGETSREVMNCKGWAEQRPDGRVRRSRQRDGALAVAHDDPLE